MFPPDHEAAASRKPKKSSIKAYDTTPSCVALRDALLRWRDEHTVLEFDTSIFEDFGGDIFLPITILRRVVDCAQAGKLLSLDNLRKELDWEADFLDRHGRALLALVHRHFPLPAPPIPPAPAGSILTERASDNTAPRGEAQTDAEVSTRKRRLPTCGACGRLGHTRKYLPCISKWQNSKCLQGGAANVRHGLWLRVAARTMRIPRPQR